MDQGKILQLIKEEFGFRKADIRKLDGYDNENFLISTETGKYIFKTYPDKAETFELVEAENSILLSLQKIKTLKYPSPVPFTDGAFIKSFNLNGKKKICRMLSFLKGEFLGDVEHSEKLFQSLGAFLADMDRDLQSLQNPVIKCRQWEWDIQYLTLNEKFINDIPDARDRNRVRYFFLQFRQNVVPVFLNLEKSIIHNDANEWNVLVEDGKVSGIIDFGDIAYSHRINELAVAITYAIYTKEDPLNWADYILESYHKVLPLKEIEISILYYLVAARLCISVCNSAHSKKTNPDNSYALVSEKHAWELLYRWLEINPVKAENEFRAAVGFDPISVENEETLIKKRKTMISPALSLSYTRAVHMTKAAFQYMYDAYGNTFLDAYNNIPHVGHSHPQVIAAGQKQMANLNTNTRYLYKPLFEYSAKLLSLFPDPLNKVFLVNSGSEASDLAIRMARYFTGKDNMLVMEHGYHGNTQTAIDISDYKFSSKAGQGQKKYILKTEIPDTYRGKYTNDDGSAGRLYAKDTIRQIKSSGQPIAAFICEPVVGCGGQVPLARDYLKTLYPEIRKHGGVCISDEVQVGFGRLGDHFWGFEAENVIPDIVILGKPMGNGHPIGAVVTTNEIAERFGQGVEFFSSFGGNPVSCAIGLAVLDVIEEEHLQENAKTVGNYYMSLFRDLQQEFSCIGDVRGSGLFIGIDIVKNGSKEPDTRLAQLIKNELRNKNILIGTDGPLDNVLKSKPPLCFTKYNAEQVADHISKILIP